MPITNLTGCTWVGNETLTFGSTAKTYDVHFYAGGGMAGEWGSIQITNNSTKVVNYESINVYDGISIGGWDGGTGPESFNTLEFDGEGTDVENATLIAWLESNGTLTAPSSTIGFAGTIVEVPIVSGYNVTVTGGYNGTRNMMVTVLGYVNKDSASGTIDFRVENVTVSFTSPLSNPLTNVTKITLKDETSNASGSYILNGGNIVSLHGGIATINISQDSTLEIFTPDYD